MKQIRWSNRKRSLLTKSFMFDLLENLKNVFNQTEVTSLNLWDIAGTGGFYTALERTCEQHNVTKAIYQFLLRQPWYVSDILDSDLMELVLEYGLVSEEDFYYTSKDLSDKEYIEMGFYIKKTITKHKGYSVISTEWTDDELESRFIGYLKPNQHIEYEKNKN